MADQNRSKLDPQKAEYVARLEAEKGKLPDSCPCAMKLIADEIDRVQTGRELNKLVEVHHDKPTKLTERVLIPIKQFPKFNFVGKLLGPKGNSLKRLQEETGTKIAILGRGSMRDHKKEDELRKEGGKYAHLSEELHCLVEAFGQPREAHIRLSHALDELSRFLIPDNNDDIRQQQFEEMMYMNGDPPAAQAPPPPRGRGGVRGRGGPPRGRGAPGALLATPGPGGRNPSAGPPSRGASRGATRGMPTRGGGRGAPPPGGRGMAPPQAPPLGRAAPGGRGSRPPAMAPRSAPASRAMDTSYEQDQYYNQQSSAAYSGAEEAYSGYEETGDYDYSQNYSATAQSDTEYYDYGHGSSSEDQSYGNDSWNQASSNYGKQAGGGRSERTMQSRAHPYAASGAPRSGAPRY